MDEIKTLLENVDVYKRQSLINLYEAPIATCLLYTSRRCMRCINNIL